MFDMAVMTGLLVVGRRVVLDGPKMSIEMGRLVRQRIYEWECEWLAVKVVTTSKKKARYFCKYVNYMASLT